MAIDPVWIWIATGVLALLIAFALFSRGARRAKSQSLRETYGSEYDRTLQTARNRKRAERELETRRDEVGHFDIRPLTASERERYRNEWTRLEQHFLTRPTAAVVEADELVAEIMRVQGYPMGDFEKHAANLSVNHPEVIEHYREGHKVIGLDVGKATTEDLRQAILHYRALFDDLVPPVAASAEVRSDVPRDIPRENEVIAPRRSEVRDSRLEDRDRRV